MPREPVEKAQYRPPLEPAPNRQSRSEPSQPAGRRGWPSREPLALDAGLAAVVAGVYLLAAWVGYALIGEDQGAPLAWPAAGVAAGVLIALGAHARIPVSIGVIAASVAVNLMAQRPLWAALALALCNAGEALFAAWLVERRCGHPFKFDDWRGLWGFLAAAALASIAAAFPAAIILQQLPGAPPFHELWRIWSSADGLGIIIVSPFLVGLYHLASEPMPRREALEGLLALSLLAATGWALFTAAPSSAFYHVPWGVLSFFFLWIAARCRPVLGAAAAVTGATALIAATTWRLGQFSGGVVVPVVQAMLLIGTLCALSLSALFADRRRTEAALREINEHLQLALGGADLGVWSVDLRTGVLDSDERDRRINGHDPAAPPRSLAEARQRYIHPDDLACLDAAFAAARQTGAACRAEYRVRPAQGADPHAVRWVAMEGSIVNDASGRPVRLMGVTRDITERKLAEQALHERTAQLALAGRAGLVGSFSYDIQSGMIQISPGLAAIYGLPEDTDEISPEDWRRRVHSKDIAVYEARRIRAFAARQRELLWEYRIRRPDGKERWIEQRSLFDYEPDGRPRREIGVNIDMTDRKRDEEHKSLLVAELDHRVKNVLAVVSALLARSSETSGSASELAAALDGRIKSMANAHELLSRCNWHGLPLRQLIEHALEPYANGSNVETGGPDVALQAEAGQALAMVVHELVTNAAKYGALSVERGRVSVRWSLEPSNGCGVDLIIDWRETDGPPVASSSHIGYGTSVIRDLVPYELGGMSELTFLPDGVRCHLQVPARWLTERAARRKAGRPASSGPSLGTRSPSVPRQELTGGSGDRERR